MKQDKTLCVLSLLAIASLPALSSAATPCPPPSLSVEGGTSASTSCQQPDTLAQKYPGDVGISGDADVVWADNFEAGSVSAVLSRYNEAKNAAGMSLTNDVPDGSRGAASLRMRSSGSGPNATDFFKNFGTGHDQLYVRYYVKYQANGPWHHSGVWFGGYNPATNWPNPRAGTKPVGNDRVSFAFEAAGSGSNVRLDFYNYWMGMHSWMAEPSGTQAYWGNSLLQDSNVRAPGDTWVCVEVNAKLNDDMASGAGGVLEVWLNDKSVQRFTNTGPLGYWVRDRFCPASSTEASCTNYRTSSTPLVPPDMRFRSSTALKLNHLWVQNYISEGGEGSIWVDDLVVAKRRVGCLR